MKKYALNAVLVLAGSLLALAVFGLLLSATKREPEATVTTTTDIRTGEPAVRYRTDDMLGYTASPGSCLRFVKRSGAEILFDTVQSFDRYGRRTVPLRSTAGRDRYLLVFGCSFAFGDAVNDDQTVPCFLAELMPAYRPYLYAKTGYGPQEMLEQLRQEDIRSEVPESDGIALYVFLNSHLARAGGSPFNLATWGAHMPCYELGSDDRLVRRGNFDNVYPIRTWIYKKIYRTPPGAWLLETLNDALARRVNVRYTGLTCRIIEESRDLFRRKLGSEKFFVVFYPWDREDALRMAPFFDKKGIRFIISDDKRLTLNSVLYSVKSDGHPNAEGNRLFAADIARKLSRALRENGRVGARHDF